MKYTFPGKNLFMKHSLLICRILRNKTNTKPVASSINFYITAGLFFILSLSSQAQTPDTSKLVSSIKDTTNVGAPSLTIRQCIDYALVHQPALNQAQINIEITRATNAINLSTWLPQINASGDAIHYIQQSAYSSSVVGTGGTTSTTTGTTGTTTGGTTTTGTSTGSSSGTSGTTTRNSASNSFIPGVSVTQTIFNPSLIYASKTAPLLITQSQQVTDSTKIYLVDAVSKAYYNVLLTLEQISVYKDDTSRLGRSLRDAYHQYKGGIVDETDYEEAAISLNNAVATLKQADENVIPQYAVLKQLMGYPPDEQFNVAYDTLRMMQDLHIDTTEQLNYEKRIEYQQVRTQQAIQDQEINYYKLAFLPTVSAFYDYNLAYENNRLNDLLSTSYPSQLVGISLSIPIFTGFSRINSVRRAKLQREQLDFTEKNLRSQIYSEYTTSLASYKSNFFDLGLLQKNVTMARRTYFVVELQYKQGIVAYLNVITAQSNLISSEISYINALFQTLSSKIDLEKAMGNISY
jgi:multidrug efflux system outer membrane protein